MSAKKILIIEDEPNIRELVLYNLKTNGYDCIAAEDGIMGITMVHREKPDLILLDVEMPVLDGFHTLESIRKMETAIDVPVIFVTGRHDRFTVFHSVQLGVDGYIVKPFEKNALLKKIDEVMNGNEGEASKETILAVDDDMAFLKQ